MVVIRNQKRRDKPAKVDVAMKQEHYLGFFKCAGRKSKKIIKVADEFCEELAIETYEWFYIFRSILE